MNPTPGISHFPSPLALWTLPLETERTTHTTHPQATSHTVPLRPLWGERETDADFVLNHPFRCHPNGGQRGGWGEGGRRGNPVLVDHPFVERSFVEQSFVGLEIPATNCRYRPTGERAFGSHAQRLRCATIGRDKRVAAIARTDRAEQRTPYNMGNTQGVSAT